MKGDLLYPISFDSIASAGSQLLNQIIQDVLCTASAIFRISNLYKLSKSI